MAVLPMTEKPQKQVIASKSAHPGFYIASWIFFSNLTILFNKWLIDTAGFREFFFFSSPLCFYYSD